MADYIVVYTLKRHIEDSVALCERVAGIDVGLTFNVMGRGLFLSSISNISPVGNSYFTVMESYLVLKDRLWIYSLHLVTKYVIPLNLNGEKISHLAWRCIGSGVKVKHTLEQEILLGGKCRSNFYPIYSNRVMFGGGFSMIGYSCFILNQKLEIGQFQVLYAVSN